MLFERDAIDQDLERVGSLFGGDRGQSRSPKDDEGSKVGSGGGGGDGKRNYNDVSEDDLEMLMRPAEVSDRA